MAKILLGRVLGAHGVRGEVKIRSLTGDPKAIASYGPLQLADGREVEITRIKAAKDHFICTLKNVTDRNAAEALRGAELFADRMRLPQEPLLADLVGRRVVHNSSVLGTIVGFQNFGAGELMEIEDGLLIPVSFAERGDPVRVDLPEGFLDDAKRVED